MNKDDRPRAIPRIISENFALLSAEAHCQVLAEVRPRKGDRILDIGGYPGNWQAVPIEAEIVTLNLEVTPGAELVDGDKATR